MAMKMMLAIALVLGAMAVTSCASEINKLESLRSTCSTAMDKIATDTQSKKDAAFVQYGKTLDSSLQDLKKRGDLDGYTVVEQESKRFQNDQTVPTNASSVHVSNAIAIYIKQIQDIEIDAESRTVNLLRQYIAALGQLIKDLMVEDKIDDARNAAEVKRNAEFALEDAEAKLPKPLDVTTKPEIVGRWTYSLNKGGFSAQVHAKSDGSVVWEGWKGTKYWTPLGTNAYLISDVKGFQGNRGWVIVHLPIVDGVAVCDDWNAGVNTCTLRIQPERLGSVSTIPVESKPATAKVVGRWMKVDTGTLFDILPDGTIVAPYALDKQRASGKWVLKGNSLTLVYPGGTVPLTLLNGDRLKGPWEFRRIAK